MQLSKTTNFMDYIVFIFLHFFFSFLFTTLKLMHCERLLTYFLYTIWIVQFSSVIIIWQFHFQPEQQIFFITLPLFSFSLNFVFISINTEKFDIRNLKIDIFQTDQSFEWVSIAVLRLWRGFFSVFAPISKKDRSFCVCCVFQRKKKMPLNVRKLCAPSNGNHQHLCA